MSQSRVRERVRKIGGTTLRSIGQIARLQRIGDNNAEFVTRADMLVELRGDEQQWWIACSPCIACATTRTTSRRQAFSR